MTRFLRRLFGGKKTPPKKLETEIKEELTDIDLFLKDFRAAKKTFDSLFGRNFGPGGRYFLRFYNINRLSDSPYQGDTSTTLTRSYRQIIKKSKKDLLAALYYAKKIEDLAGKTQERVTLLHQTLMDDGVEVLDEEQVRAFYLTQNLIHRLKQLIKNLTTMGRYQIVTSYLYRKDQYFVATTCSLKGIKDAVEFILEIKEKFSQMEAQVSSLGKLDSEIEAFTRRLLT